MPDHRLCQLIARKLSGEATEAELKELNDYLAGNTSEQYLYEILNAYWSQHPDLFNEESLDEEERFQRILKPILPDTNSSQIGSLVPESTDDYTIKKINYRRWFKYAAVMMAVAAGIIFYQYINKQNTKTIQPEQQKISEVVARPGSRTKLILPDGTQVWLNSESRITYKDNFNSKLREIQLEGEAFFDVTHDAKRPFIVHTSGVDIKVLGTAFNVKSYESDETIETTLLRGSVEIVKHNDPDSLKIILRPHEKVIFNKVLHTSVKNSASGSQINTDKIKLPTSSYSVIPIPQNRPDSVISETSWVYNKLILNGDNFEELVSKLERRYNVSITIKSNSLKQFRIKGTFKDETIQQTLDALKFTVPFNYTINGDEIEIFRK